jgi:steroid delta-isomerase-like uncharacterized protein
MSTEENEAVVRRFYDELWNSWELEVADEIVSETIDFRGSLGKRAQGRNAFKAYVEALRRAFPDWRNVIDEMVAAGDRVAVRMTWSGTHEGTLNGIESTGARVEYSGAAFFLVRAGVIEKAWVVGDTDAFWQALRGAC